MAKDPAFLFYSSDFLSGTMFMTNEQVGMYIRLLCAQHQHGRLMPSQCQVICHGTPDADVLAKFKVDERGMLYNERIDLEITKRKNFTQKQSERAKKRWDSRGIAVADAFLEDRNRNENRIEDKDKGGLGEKKFNPELAQKIFEEYSSERIWLEGVSGKIRVGTVERTIELLRRFIEYQSLSNGLEGRSERDIKNHFLNWVNLNPKEVEDVMRKTKSQPKQW